MPPFTLARPQTPIVARRVAPGAPVRTHRPQRATAQALADFAPVVGVVALVPAYNEAAGIGATLQSLLRQSHPVDHIVVIANNCTDETAEIARSTGVTVIEMPDNPHKKAGALNEAWTRYCQQAEYVFTMDADTVLAVDTIQHLYETLSHHPDVAAVCSRYWAQKGWGLPWRLQRLEYARYDDARRLRSWRVQVASGASVLYRGEALAEVIKRKRRPAPWDTNSLIEDYGLTLDLKEGGHQVRASALAEVYTATPKTFKALWTQRLRWGRGGVDECRRRGWNRATRRDIVSYWLFGLSVAMRALFVAFLAMMIIGHLPYQFSILGVGLIVLWWIERVTSVAKLADKTWKDRLIVWTLLVEDLYGFFLEACTVVAVIKSFRASGQQWR